MKEIDIINEFHSLLIEAHQERDLKYLSESKFDSKEAIEYYNDNCTDRRNNDKMFDIIYCSNHINYCLANIALYEKYASSLPFQRFTRIDKIYCNYIGSVIEKYYNFWDRIGDLINFHYQVLPEKIEDFARVIDKLAQDGKNSISFNYLKSYKENEEGYIKLNRYRKNTVHHYSLESQHLRNFDPFDRLEELKKHTQLINFLFDSHSKILEGFEHTVKFIGEKEK